MEQLQRLQYNVIWLFTVSKIGQIAFYPGVYDGLDNVMFEYKNGDMEMQVNLDMNNKIISGLINPLYDSEAMNLGYFTNLFKTKYTGTIASGVFQRTNPTNNFQIAADGKMGKNKVKQPTLTHTTELET